MTEGSTSWDCIGNFNDILEQDEKLRCRDGNASIKNSLLRNVFQ